MSNEPTVDQLIDAAKSLDSNGFTRADLAEKLGVKPMDLNDSVKAAREAGKLEKAGNNDAGKGVFRVTGQ